GWGMGAASMVTHAGPFGGAVPPRNEPKTLSPGSAGAQWYPTILVWPGGTSMNAFATTSKMGFSWRFTSFDFLVISVTLARARCGTESPLIQCELSTRPITGLPPESSGVSLSAVPFGISQRECGPCDVATMERSLGLPLPKLRHAGVSFTSPAFTSARLPW